MVGSVRDIRRRGFWKRYVTWYDYCLEFISTWQCFCAETVEDEGVDDGFDNEGKPIYRSCDKRRTLYFLNQTKFIPENPFPAVINTTCNRPYYLQKVVNSNLLLVVVEPLHTCDRTFNTDEEEILYPTTTYQCKKLNLNNLTRRRLAGCFNEHPLVRKLFPRKYYTKVGTNILLL